MAKKKWTLGKGNGKEERGKGKGENVGAGKVGKLNDHHKKQPYVALKTKREKWGECVNKENGKNLRGQHSTKQQKGTCKNVGILSFIDESIHVIHWLRATWLGAPWWCPKTRDTVRVRHKGIPLCQ